MSSMMDILGSNPTVDSLKSRGVNPSVLFPQNPLDQNITPMSANFDPNMEASTPFPPVPSPDKSPTSLMGQMTPQPQANPNPQTVPMGGGNPSLATNPAQKPPEALKSEAELIVSALLKRLDHHSKMEQSTLPQNG